MHSLINTPNIRLVLLVVGYLMVSAVNAVTVISSEIQRVNLDGSGLMTILVTELGSGAYSSAGLALDVSGGQMYWTQHGRVQRANLDGSKVTDLGARGDFIALDVGSRQMYLTLPSSIHRANFDGTEVKDLVEGLDIAISIELDVGNGQMYWADSDRGKIQKSNLDGSGVTDLVTRLDGY